MQKNNSHSINLITPVPVPRIVVCQAPDNKWRGCIYFSSIDLTAEILTLFKTNTGNSAGKFLNNPIYYFASVNKSTVDAKISETINSLFHPPSNQPEESP